MSYSFFGTEDGNTLTCGQNAVVDLMHERKLDHAEQAARDLLERRPEVPDGYDRLGMVYEGICTRTPELDCRWDHR